MIYLIRENGQLRIEHDLHHLGLFSLAVWRRLLLDVGFEIHAVEYDEDGKSFGIRLRQGAASAKPCRELTCGEIA